MKSLKINLTKGTETTEMEVKSECAMWNALRKVRNELTDELLTSGVRALVTDADGKPFKDITFRKNSKGKIEMPNAVKETNRIRTKPIEKKAKKEGPIKSFNTNDLTSPSGTTSTEMNNILADVKDMAEVETN